MIHGLNEFVGNFKEFCAEIEGGVLPEVMVDALKPTIELSAVYAPKDTHEMVNSRYVEVRKRRGGPVAEAGYGKGGQAPYTVFVHENPNFFHEPPTQAKFLQRALDEDFYSILGRIATGVKQRAGT
jgi:hypothetical protein